MLTKEKQNTAFDALSETFGYSSRMSAPRIEKVVISTGTGKRRDKKQNEIISNRLATITGQKPSVRPAKQSVASFKVREGEPVGLQVTLRGSRMYDFIDKFIHIALPRTRDFRGLSTSAIDDMGNVTFGIKEHTIFPEVEDEDLRNVFGLAITIVTTAKTRKESEAFLRHIGIPFRVDAAPKR